MLRPHIVILGAGFGGVYAAKKLAEAARMREIDVTIVNKTNSFLFTPLLHEVATGALNPRSVAEPLREIFSGSYMNIVQGWAESIDTTMRTISVKGETETVSLKYDYLIIATGAETNYYGIPGAAENALPLKSLVDASLIRNRTIDAFEQAVLIDDATKRKSMLSFVVIGGGATGVEVAAELIEFIDGIEKRYYDKIDVTSSVTLVHASKELLEQFTPSLRKNAYDHLVKKGVKVMLSTAVTGVTKNAIALASGEIIPASMVIWSAGVKALLPKFIDAQPTLVGGRLALDSHFKLLGKEREFAMGDVAAYIDSAAGPSAKPLPQLAQVAESEAATVAGNILALIRGKPLQDFHYTSKGSMVSVGQWFAIGEIYAMKMAGKFTWWMWRTVYLFKFASWKKRVRIGLEWFLAMFFPRDITKIS